MSTVIRVEGLSKKYIIGHQSDGGYSTFRETMTRSVRNTGRRLLSPFRSSSGQPLATLDSTEEFWALKDISFEIKQGERVGIIGRNGAGKTTLLKILSRITEPTEGKVSINGKVASLLEVGTGFHPELTGRENIFLNGAVLGMGKDEIKRRFDEIVDFAEVERFLDTPVKRYSSGMYVRLAFAVAAHLEPEILLVDEVLAVGDAQFQKKCLGKMDAVSREGRTILFVSHNMAAIRQLCSLGMLLQNGRIVEKGRPDEVVNSYLSISNTATDAIDLKNYEDRKGNGYFQFNRAKIVNSEGQVCQDFSIGDDIKICFELVSKHNVRLAKLAVQIRASDGTPLCNMIDVDSGFVFSDPGLYENISVLLKDVRFYPGSYFINLWVGHITSTGVYDWVEDCLMFNIIDGGKLTMRYLPREAGLLFLTPEWHRDKKNVGTS